MDLPKYLLTSPPQMRSIPRPHLSLHLPEGPKVTSLYVVAYSITYCSIVLLSIGESTRSVVSYML